MNFIKSNDSKLHKASIGCLNYLFGIYDMTEDEKRKTSCFSFRKYISDESKNYCLETKYFCDSLLIYYLTY